MHRGRQLRRRARARARQRRRERPAGRARSTSQRGDVFEWLRRARDSRRSFDLIVLDPPKLAPRRARTPSARRAPTRTSTCSRSSCCGRAGVLLTFSCSAAISADLFQKIVASAAADARRRRGVRAPARPGRRSPGRAGVPRGRVPEGPCVCRCRALERSRRDHPAIWGCGAAVRLISSPAHLLEGLAMTWFWDRRPCCSRSRCWRCPLVRAARRQSGQREGEADIELGANQASDIETERGFARQRRRQQRQRVAAHRCGGGRRRLRLAIQVRLDAINMLGFADPGATGMRRPALRGPAPARADRDARRAPARRRRAVPRRSASASPASTTIRTARGEEFSRSGFVVQPARQLRPARDESAALALLGWLNLGEPGRERDLRRARRHLPATRTTTRSAGA